MQSTDFLLFVGSFFALRCKQNLQTMLPLVVATHDSTIVVIYSQIWPLGSVGWHRA
jgi:hypothetical protein